MSESENEKELNGKASEEGDHTLEHRGRDLTWFHIMLMLCCLLLNFSLMHSYSSNYPRLRNRGACNISGGLKGSSVTLTSGIHPTKLV